MNVKQPQSRYLSTRQRTVDICSPLELEDYVPQPVVFVSPPKWHLGHTTWFFETFILTQFVSDYQLFHPDYGFVFNSYYNTVGERVVRENRGNLSRPVLSEVMAYRAHVDEHLSKLLSTNNEPQILSLLEIGLNHEEQHQELLITDLKYILGSNPLLPIYKAGHNLSADQNKSDESIAIDSGMYEIGHTEDSFCFDNELSPHQVYVDSFEIQNRLVTNSEFLEFIQDDGYKRHELWLDEGWAWVNQNNINSPLYWHKIDGQWHRFTLAGLVALEPNNILAHVSHYEAAAFAEWKSARLPTEFEWEIASDKIDWGTRWEHTGSAYLAYPGFKKPKGAVGEYNGKFMMNQMVLRGASVATPPGHSRKTYRNFFHPNLQWQFSGIRLINT